MTVERKLAKTDRAFGDDGSEITLQVWATPCRRQILHVICNGYGGPSFRAFIPAGLTRNAGWRFHALYGQDALSGGKLIVYHSQDVTYDPASIIIGNVPRQPLSKAFINRAVAGELLSA